MWSTLKDYLNGLKVVYLYIRPLFFLDKRNNVASAFVKHFKSFLYQLLNIIYVSVDSWFT